MSNITYNIKISFINKKDYNLLLDTLLEHQKIWNYISQDTFNNKDVNKKIIHDRNYYKCRKLFPDAPSEVIIRAREFVYSAYKILKTSKKLNSLEKPCEQKNLSIRLDKRLYTFLKNNQIKLTTTKNKRKRITGLVSRKHRGFSMVMN
jgi:hypothetical protein